MKRTFGSLIAAAGVLTGAVLAGGLVAVGPAHADPTDAGVGFINSLSNAGVPVVNNADTVALGQSVCPMLAQPGQTVADAAAKVADASGMSLGPATMFTGLAISAFCPAVVTAIGNGQSPLPLGLLGLG
jgi:hypothetical protein